MTLSQDLRFAIRFVARDRRVTVAAIAALSLAIAANATVFSLYNGMFFRSLPFDDPDRVVIVNTRLAANPDSNLPVSFRQFEDWRRDARSFAGLAAYSQATLNLSETDRVPERLWGAYVSGHLFALLGEEPAFGRSLRVEDDRPGAPAVVVLSHRTWMTRYEGRPGVIGSSVRVNGTPATIVGVMREDFGFPTDATAWQPLALLGRRDANERNILVVGRLGADVTVSQALAELTQLEAARPETPAAGGRLVPKVRSFRDFSVGGRMRTAIAVLMVGVGLVLLVACANVANLLLARGVQRSGDIAVRMAIGASRRQVVRQLLLDSVVLAAAATVAGFLMSLAGVRLFERAIADTGAPYWLDFSLDWRVFAFIALVCLAAAAAFGLLPALHATRTQPAVILGHSPRGAVTPSGRRWSDALVIAQFALTLTLLVGAGLLLRELIALRQMQVGIPTNGVTVMRIDLPPRQQYETAESRSAFYARLGERLERLTGMQATYASLAPASGAAEQFLAIDGHPAGDARSRPVSQLLIGPRYFEALGAGAVRGRTLTATDREGVAIVNARLAELYFPGQDPIGARVRFEQWRADIPASGWFTIVGVAPDIRQRSMGDRPIDPVIYVPYGPDPAPFTTLIVKSPLATEQVSTAVRTLVADIDPHLPVFDIRTLDDALDAERWATRLFGTMFSVVATMALLLASVGLYALTAYSVSLRTREIGVRIALGGRGRHIWWAVGSRGVAQIIVGLTLGIGGALAMERALQDIVRSSAASTAPTLTAVAALLAMVAVAACLVPARRAMRLNPVDALRAD